MTDEAFSIPDRVWQSGFNEQFFPHGFLPKNTRIFFHSHFPYWAILEDNGSLSNKQTAERCDAFIPVIPYNVASKTAGSIAPFSCITRETERKGEEDGAEEVVVKPVLVLLPQTFPSKNAWALLTDLPPSFITNAPESKDVLHLMNLHELGHLLRERKSTFNDEEKCDSAAIATLQARGGGEASIEAWIHARTLNLLTDKPRYWFAPILAAERNGTPPPTEQEVRDCAIQIRRAVALEGFEATGKKILSHTPSLLDQAILYHHSVEKPFKTRPLVIFERLNALVQKGAFDAQPLTRKIAESILNAADYFNPGCLKKPSNTTPTP